MLVFMLKHARLLVLSIFQAWHVFRLSLLCHVVQIVCTAQEGQADEMELDHPASTGEWRLFHQSLHRQVRSEKWVTEQCLPFLRSSAILFHFITSVPFPKLDDAYDNYAEAGLWLRYMGVESLEQLVKDPWAKSLTAVWNSTLVSRSSPPWIFPVQSSGLITLPSDYSELINVASLFTCPNSEGDEARTPAMCLVCGKMLCSQVLWFIVSSAMWGLSICLIVPKCLAVSQSYCCQTELDGQQVGACTAHAQVCGLGACLFLRVRECKLLLMAGKSKGKLAIF